MAKSMKKTVKSAARKQVTTTVGDLLAAAYDAAGCSADRAADLIERGPLGRLVKARRLQFV
jgi:hypothetical protein